MLKFMITAASSNSGKTAVTCGMLALLRRKGYDPCAFKCGPDYIDPMFHRSVLGIESSNLDVFLAGEDGVREVFSRGSAGHDAAVCEGVMGYYDGMTPRTGQGTKEISGAEGGEDAGPASARASAWHVASLLQIPAILVLRPKGAALTLAAVIRGLAQFRTPSRICGVIFNDCSEMYYRMYAPVIEAESGIPVLGYLPHMEEAAFESRHLGLMTAEEIRDLADRIDRIGARMEETIDFGRLMELTEQGPADRQKAKGPADVRRIADAGRGDEKPAEEQAPDAGPGAGIPIAVARDEAFNFIYAETIRALEDAGAEIRYFSPLRDQALPAGICGLYLPGGYPELYGQQLAENESMRTCIRQAVEGGLPTIAECGGFLYLSRSLADADGKTWPMAGVLSGHGAGTGKLVRFGYGTISCRERSMLFRPGEEIPAHEFHYWDTTAPGSDLTLTKNSSGKQWEFGYAGETLYAGFPHLYPAGKVSMPGGEPAAGGILSGEETLAGRFADAARRFREAGPSRAEVRS